ncbi:MAG: FAD-binding oxidoreductase [Acidobacteria bacterium]|nr:FAD-binding oxidoreductase [Acidobacteriota bacterium]
MSPATSISLSRLREISGAAHVVEDPAQLTAFEIDGLRPTAAVAPASVDELAEIIRFAASEQLALVPCGGRTKLAMGMPPARFDIAVSSARLNRVLAFDPGDLTLGVEAGISIAALNAQLAEKGQFLPLRVAFEDSATIGGIIATNSSSPLRHAFGGPRDYVLGMEFVTGEGFPTKSGGRVVKSVAGYDIHKLLIGSLGTLGVITRVNFKTFPLPPAQRTFVASFAAPEPVLAFCRALAQSVLQPWLVEVVDPAAAAVLSSDAYRLPAGKWCVVTAACGKPSIVERHARDLPGFAERAQAAEFVALSDAQKSSLLGRVREFPRHARDASPAATLVRFSVLPTQIPALLSRMRQIAEQNQLPLAMLVRASGFIFAALMPPEKNADTLRRLTAAAQEFFRAADDSSARAMIEWCPSELKRELSVWGPPRDDLALMRSLKNEFDPRGILSPGRFHGGL